ncbi:MAG TPA: hypothetical protein VF331_16120, partial [Polyangiales bacterium]
MGLALLAGSCSLLAADPASAQSHQPSAAAPAKSSAGADEGVIVELGVGFAIGERDDAYQRRLEAFDFKWTGSAVGRVSVAAGLRVQRHFALGIEYFGLDGTDYKRSIDGVTQKFAWDSRAIGAFVQADLGGGRQRFGNLFLRGGAGLAFGSTAFDAIDIAAPNADASPSFQAQPVTV